MSKSKDNSTDYTDYGTTIVELSKRSDGTWEATQTGLDVVGTGLSAARATADMARQIADQQDATNP